MKILTLMIAFAFSSAFALAQVREAVGYPTADGLVTQLYDMVSFEAGTTPDWNEVRKMFLDEAVITLRTSRDSLSVFSVDGFIDDFIRFEGQVRAKNLGFKETILAMRPVVVGDMAQVLVLYQTVIPGLERQPQKGIDSFHLIRKNGRWWITSIVNELVTEDNPIPEELSEQ
ncbi:MAG: hypothetical protein IPJ40_23105 [Saprospirales bacterium]|nr:hypothetical protein [Saprospirales bacterium]